MTFGKQTAIPGGYYELCKAGNAVCRTSRGANVVDDGVVRLDARLLKELSRVNADVNRAIRPVEDSVQYHVADRWNVAPKSGDCEDFALTKKARLLKLGWPSSALLIATANTAAGAEHAVLIARTDRGDFVLDNLRKDIRPWSAGLYRWTAIQAPRDVWTWYKFGGGTIRVASNAGREAGKPLPVVSMAEPGERRLPGPERSPALADAPSAANFAPITMNLRTIGDTRPVVAAAVSASVHRLPGPLSQVPPAWLDSFLCGATVDTDCISARAYADRCSGGVMAGEIALWSAWLERWTKLPDTLARQFLGSPPIPL